MTRPNLIIIEGCDSSGKSTLINEIYRNFNYEFNEELFKIIREPYDLNLKISPNTRISKRRKKILFLKRLIYYSYLANKYKNTSTTIVTDRSFISTFVYNLESIDLLYLEKYLEILKLFREVEIVLVINFYLYKNSKYYRKCTDKYLKVINLLILLAKEKGIKITYRILQRNIRVENIF